MISLRNEYGDFSFWFLVSEIQADFFSENTPSNLEFSR